MRDTYLMSGILRFLEEFRVVEERQVYAFFADCGYNETGYALRRLKEQHRIYPFKDTTRITANPWINNANNYDAVIDALDVMCQLRSQEVDWYKLRDIPFELEFAVDGFLTVFTVSVFDRRTWVNRYEQTKRLRSLNLPVGEPDPRKHIAVVEDEALIEKIAPLGFDMYVKIKDRLTGELEKWTV